MQTKCQSIEDQDGLLRTGEFCRSKVLPVDIMMAAIMVSGSERRH